MGRNKPNILTCRVLETCWGFKISDWFNFYFKRIVWSGHNHVPFYSRILQFDYFDLYTFGVILRFTSIYKYELSLTPKAFSTLYLSMIRLSEQSFLIRTSVASCWPCGKDRFNLLLFFKHFVSPMKDVYFCYLIK